MMKAYIISDESWFGGASIANHRIMEAFTEKGWDIEMKVVNTTTDEWQSDFSADLYIIANFAYIDRKALEKLFNEKKVVKFFHDIPGYMYQPKTIKLDDHYKYMQMMIDKALLNVFISPFQLEVYQRFIVVKAENSIILPPPKDMSGFMNLGLDRNLKEVLYLGDISKSRGIYESIEVAKQNDWIIHFIGPWVDEELVKELQDNGFKVDKEIDNNLVSSILNQYEYFIYLPNLMDSFCFKVVEAELCGCKLVVDHYRIGRYTYPQSLEDLKTLIETSHFKLVEKVEELLNGIPAS